MAEKVMLEMESGRKTLDEHRVIHFCKEGNFYRAYEFSAWLAFRFAGELNVTRRYSKAASLHSRKASHSVLPTSCTRCLLILLSISHP